MKSTPSAIFICTNCVSAATCIGQSGPQVWDSSVGQDSQRWVEDAVPVLSWWIRADEWWKACWSEAGLAKLTAVLLQRRLLGLVLCSAHVTCVLRWPGLWSSPLNRWRSWGLAARDRLLTVSRWWEQNLNSGTETTLLHLCCVCIVLVFEGGWGLSSEPQKYHRKDSSRQTDFQCSSASVLEFLLVL